MSEREKREDRVARLRAAGVEIPDGNSVYIGEEVVVEAGAVIWPNNHVYGRSHIAAGAVLYLAVVMGMAPPKGVSMPFISYGGSSLLASMICVGFLLNYSRTVRE